MKLRAHSAAVAAGTVAMFAWQTLSNTVLPWHGDDPAPPAGAIGGLLGQQAGIDLVGVLALAVLISALHVRSPLGAARAAALAGFAVVFVNRFADVVWLGADASQAVVAVIDQTISFGVAGLAIGLVMRKLDPDVGVELPRGQGYWSSGRKTVAR